MGILRPATPGFIITLVATILLIVVVFCVPYLKSVYFLKAAIDYQGVSGNITFGTLGYCMELAGSTTCSKPSIGYQLDINSLVGNNSKIKIPQIAVKWITYALFLHVIALVAAAGSAIFGLLAHVREVSMVCCSTCFSGLAAAITLVAFIIDVVLFLVAKARINAVGSAQIGNALWLTLAAWVLLFFSGCFFTLGRCCIRNRPYRRNPDLEGPDKGYAQLARLDAVKAEQDRKAAQQLRGQEGGLPAFPESQRLYMEGDNDIPDNSPAPSRQQSRIFQQGGYTPGIQGARAVDQYHDTSSTDYPSQREVRRQQSERSTYSMTANSPILQYDPTPLPSNGQPRGPLYNAPDPFAPEYGHTAGGTSYHTAISDDQGPPYGYVGYPPLSSYPDISPPSQPPISPADPFHYGPPPEIHRPQPSFGDRSYTLGGAGYGIGDGYGNNQFPPLSDHTSPPPPASFSQLPPIDTNAGRPPSPPPGYSSAPYVAIEKR